MKTVQDYLNAPRLLNDPAMLGALEPVREIHAARLKIQDETAGMTVAERVAFLNMGERLFSPPWAKPSAMTWLERGSWNTCRRLSARDQVATRPEGH